MRIVVRFTLSYSTVGCDPALPPQGILSSPHVLPLSWLAFMQIPLRLAGPSRETHPSPGPSLQRAKASTVLLPTSVMAGNRTHTASIPAAKIVTLVPGSDTLDQHVGSRNRSTKNENWSESANIREVTGMATQLYIPVMLVAVSPVWCVLVA